LFCSCVWNMRIGLPMHMRAHGGAVL
jgi:hypothetical protein